MKVTWHQRRVPLPIVGAIAFGARARELGAILLQRDCSRFLGAAANDILVVQSPEVPYVPDLLWLGESSAPGLWLPTLLEPNVHEELLLRAVSRITGLPSPLAVTPTHTLSLAALGPLHEESLRTWLA